MSILGPGMSNTPPELTQAERIALEANRKAVWAHNEKGAAEHPDSYKHFLDGYRQAMLEIGKLADNMGR